SSHQFRAGPAGHPMPVDSSVNSICKIANVGLIGMGVVEVLPRVQRAGEKKRGVNGRQFAFPRTQARVHIKEMVEPTSITDIARGIGTLRLSVERPQCPQYSLPTLLACDPTVVNADTNGRQSKTDGGDAGIGVGSGTVTDESVRWIGFEPEVIECLSLKELEKVGVASKLVRRCRRLGHRIQERAQTEREKGASYHVEKVNFNGPRVNGGPTKNPLLFKSGFERLNGLTQVAAPLAHRFPDHSGTH